MDATLAGAIVAAIGAIVAAGIAARTAARAASIKQKSDDNRLAIDGFKDLTAEHKAEIIRLRAELAEERAVAESLMAKVETQDKELRRLRGRK